jgi:hypothetical protein
LLLWLFWRWDLRTICPGLSQNAVLQISASQIGLQVWATTLGHMEDFAEALALHGMDVLFNFDLFREQSGEWGVTGVWNEDMGDKYWSWSGSLWPFSLK